MRALGNWSIKNNVTINLVMMMNPFENPGIFQAIWEGLNERKRLVGSGIYVVYIKAETINETKKIAVIR